MIPKEKAIELTEKMAIYHWTDVCNYEEAKQCALIAVNEIINIKLLWFQKDTKDIDFWKEVKEELLKL